MSSKAPSATRPPLRTTVILSCRANPVRRARKALRSFIEEYGLVEHLDGPAGHEVTYGAMLVVSELVTNACVHADAPLAMHLGRYEDTLFIEVCDGSRSLPRLVAADESGPEGGFGLGIVLAMADHWSAVRTSWGKRVVVVLPLPDGRDALIGNAQHG
ncbi:ATP-binding protein [Streptomyces parvus]|uniref:ATP-binding protein n=1 Tax=Streptomyces parvus TaxID=66428 RepID=A0A7K3S2H8_9ACTN|nr:ATP-binding protein [Streptomyces parvus]NEC21704.1 ATP-binding protein [Streptomyces parvus]